MKSWFEIIHAWFEVLPACILNGSSPQARPITVDDVNNCSHRYKNNIIPPIGGPYNLDQLTLFIYFDYGHFMSTD